VFIWPQHSATSEHPGGATAAVMLAKNML